MADFVFEDRWYLAAPVPRVAAVVVDLEHYPQWWPQILAVASLGPDDARVLCRSTLPYTLDLVLHAVTRDPPVLEVELSGDLEGRVAWTLHAAGDGTRMDLYQRVGVRGVVLSRLSRIGAPVMRWNHARMMRGCLTGLHARLDAGD